MLRFALFRHATPPGDITIRRLLPYCRHGVFDFEIAYAAAVIDITPSMLLFHVTLFYCLSISALRPRAAFYVDCRA